MTEGDRSRDGKGVTTVASYCRVCPALCGILVEVDAETNKVIGIKGDPDNPISRGYTCPKGRALPEEHNAADRLTSSYRRRDDGTFEAIPSSQAIDEIAARLTSIVGEHGARAVALYVGTRGYEVLPLRSSTAWLHGLGSPSLYSTYTIDQPGKDLARALHGSWPAGFHDVATSQVVMLVGTNPMVSAVTPYISMPMSNLRIELRALKRQGLKLIVVDPRITETAQWADVHLRPRPGTDALVLAGIIRIIFEEGSFDKSFVRQYSRGATALRRAVDAFTPEVVERRTAVPVADLVQAARVFARAPRGCAVGGTGINMAPHPILTEYLLLCLNTICGRYRRAGETVTNPGVLTGGRSPAAGPRGPRPIWGKGEDQPRVRGLTTMYDQMPAAALSDEILTPGPGQIRALLVSGGNPLVALPDQIKTIRALDSLELLVALDVRLTQTAARSDYVIGCKLSLEKSDTTLGSDLRFPHPFAQYAAPVVDPDFDVIEEWEFFWELAHRMGTPWELSGRVGMPIPIDVDSSLDTTTKPTAEDLWRQLCSASRVPFDDVLGAPHGLEPAMPPVIIADEPSPLDDEDRLDLGAPLMISELESLAVPEPSKPEYPFLLTSRRMWEYYNSWGQNIRAMRARVAYNPAFMHPHDMEALGLQDDDIVEIASERATVHAVVQSAPDVAGGTVSIAHCWGSSDPNDDAREVGTATSRLVDNEEGISEFVGMARQSAIPVRISLRDDEPAREAE